MLSVVSRQLLSVIPNERTKCVIPEHSSFFIQLHRSNKGHAKRVLDAENLDLLLVKELLEKEGLEFETMRVQGTRTLEDSELSNSLLKTAKKVSRNILEEAMEEALSFLGTRGVSANLKTVLQDLEVFKISSK